MVRSFFDNRMALLACLVLALLLSAVWWHGYITGRHAAEQAAAADRLASLRQARQTEQQLAKKTAHIDTQFAATTANQAVAAEKIRGKVRDYAKNNHTVCTLPAGWLQLHDTAAGVPETASTASGIDDTTATAAADDAAALAIVTANYATYQQVASQLTALQDWVRTMRPADEERQFF